MVHRANLRGGVVLLIALLLGSCHHDVTICCGPLPQMEKGELLRRLFGDRASQAKAEEISHPLGGEVQVYEVQLFTRPHIPRTIVAVAPGPELLPLSGLDGGLFVTDAVANFNRAAQLSVAPIRDDRVESYFRFFLSSYIGSFEESAFLATRSQAVAALNSSGLRPGDWHDPLRITRVPQGPQLLCWYRTPFEIVELRITLDQQDGTVTLERELFGRLES